MKLFALALLFALPVFAKEVNVECKMMPNAFRNQFATEFSFDDEAVSFENIEINVKLLKSGRDMPIEEFTTLRSGTISVIRAGDLAKNDIFVLSSVERGNDIQVMTLVVDYPSAFTSKLALKDFKSSYSSTCRIKK